MTATPADVAAIETGRHNGARLLDAATQLRADADQLLTMDVDHIDVDTCIRIAAAFKMAKGAIGAAEEFLAKHTSEVWQGKWSKDRVVEGVGTGHPYRSSKDVWDHDVVQAVIDKRMADSGGVLPDPHEVARWLLDVLAVNYFRVGKLEELDIDPQEYRHKEYGSVRLSVKTSDEIGATTRPEATP
jgi:hypothetical protein